MEIFEEEDEEIKQLMLRISRKEITLCETCDAFFNYVPQKTTCDECKKARQREYQREYHREYYRRPEVKKRKRQYEHKYRQRPEVMKRRREYGREYQRRPEVKKRQRERYYRLKQLREEE